MKDDVSILKTKEKGNDDHEEMHKVEMLFRYYEVFWQKLFTHYICNVSCDKDKVCGDLWYFVRNDIEPISRDNNS